MAAKQAALSLFPLLSEKNLAGRWNRAAHFGIIRDVACRSGSRKMHARSKFRPKRHLGDAHKGSEEV